MLALASACVLTSTDKLAEAGLLEMAPDGWSADNHSHLIC